MPHPDVGSWSGVYIGAHGGFGWARDPFTDDVFFGKAAPIGGIGGNGFVGGFQAGANWQAGSSWVGGLEIDLSATSIKGSTFGTTGNLLGGGSTFVESQTRTDKFDWLGSGRVRAGYLPLPDVLIYGTAGLAWTRLEKTDDLQSTLSTTAGFEADTQSSSSPSWRFGAVAGVGAEVRLWNSNWLGRVEYLHYDFGKSNTFSSSDPNEEIVTSGNLTLDVVRAGLSYKLGGGFADSAMATAMPVKAPLAAAPAWTWSGFYIGGHAGYGWGHDPINQPAQGLNSDITLTGIGSNGFLGGFQAGANWQARNAWVGGLELDLTGSGIKGSNTYTGPYNGRGTETLTQTDKLDLLGSARARVGYLLWPDVLLYGTGGLAWTRLVQSTDDAIPGFASSTATVSWEFGWVAGGGVETRLWNSNWLGRIEYLHYDFGDSGSSFSGPLSESTGRLTADVVRGGLSYKLDWSDPAGAPAGMGMPVKAPPALAISDWSGFYLGGHAGYGWGRDPVSSAASNTGTFVTLDPVLKSDVKSNGFVAGFQAGANRQMGAWVGGLEIDISATGIKGSTTNASVAGDEIETNTDRFDTLGSARARVGYLAWPNVLFYGTGGLAWARVNQSVWDLPIGGTVNGSATPAWEFGWVAGAGSETRLWDTNWFWRVEYLHYDFGDSGSTVDNQAGSTTIAGSGTASASSLTGHLTTDVVRTGFSYKLN